MNNDDEINFVKTNLLDLGAIGWIGGEKIAAAVEKLGNMTLKEMYTPIVDIYKNVKIAVTEALEGELITSIF